MDSGMKLPDGDAGAFPIAQQPQKPVGPGPAAISTSFNPHFLDFGHDAGRTIEELAEIDPDYLRWLERHQSGVRYRAEIRRVLGSTPTSIDWGG
jgi:hypothetical protein